MSERRPVNDWAPARPRGIGRRTAVNLRADLSLWDRIEFWRALRSGNRVGRRRRSIRRHDDIARGVLRRIAEGDLTPGSPLPVVVPGRRVSVQTIRRSVQSLLHDGFVRPGPESGLYVAHEIPPAMRRQIAAVLASGQPLRLAEAAAFEIVVHSHRIGSTS